MIGMLNSTTEWLFAYPGRLSTTTSGADRLLDLSREELAATIWQEVAHVAELPRELPPWQVVRERRATFAATPEENARRPGAATALAQSLPCGRLDRHGLARDHRRCHSVRQPAAELALRHWSTQMPREAGPVGARCANDGCLGTRQSRCDATHLRPRPHRLDPALDRHIAAATDAILATSSRTGTGSTSSRPTRPFRPNTC